MLNCKSVVTRQDQKMLLSEEEKYKAPYQQLLGTVMYLSVCSRPDISFAVFYLTQFNMNHTKEHCIAAKRLVRYLKVTKDLGIVIKKN